MGGKNGKEQIIEEINIIHDDNHNENENENDMKGNDDKMSSISSNVSSQQQMIGDINGDINGELKEVDFKIFVGIDFGTDGCGLAYAVRNNLNDDNKYNDDENALNIEDNIEFVEYVEIHSGFKDAHGPYDKSRTSVLLDGDNNVQSVGGEAANMFVQAENKNNWKLFERFKMNLYENPHWKSPKILSINNDNGNNGINKVNLKDMIIPSNGGDPYPSKEIFIAELKKLHIVALEYLKMMKQKKKINFKYGMDDIQWILTVPAIWSDYAKNKMKQWSIESNIININIYNQLKIVYEPDCASLAVQYGCNKWDKWDKNKKQQRNIPICNDNNNGIINFDSSDDSDRDYGEINNNNNNNDNDIIEIDEMNLNLNDNDDDDDDEEEMKYTAKGYTFYLEKQVICLRDNIDPSIRFNIDDIYILIDVGGGTCDIACHRIIDKYLISEILHPTGGKWGSMNIDLNFQQLLQELFGANIINEFKLFNGGMWLQLKNNFCNDCKPSFYNDKTRSIEYHHITLPMNFATFIIEKYDDNIDNVDKLLNNKSMELFNEYNLIKWEIGKWNDNTLSIHNKIFINYLFERNTIKPIINHLMHILNRNEMINCKYMILVGGLSNSRYYQQRIYNKFVKNNQNKNNQNLKIIVPEKPQLSVVEGAARYGIIPNFIQTRIISKTYGIRIDYALQSLPNRHKYNIQFLNENTYRCNQTKKEYVKNIFSIFVQQNDAIKFNDKPFIQTYFRRHSKQKTIDIKIYESTKIKPLHVLENECNELGEIQLLFNTNKYNKTDELEILVEFWFNDTTLKVFAYPKDRKNMKKQYEIHYL